MDIELILDVLNKHGVTNIALAEDIQTLAKECYKDGAFDESNWWMYQDTDNEWIAQFELAKDIMEEDKDVLSSLATGEEIIGDVPYLAELSEKDAETFTQMLEQSNPPNQELLDAYERYKKANIKFDLDKPLDEQNEDE